MELLTLAAYAGAIVVGTVLGILGGGGSILMIPLLVYGFGMEPITATGYSLFIVGVAALAGSIGYIRKGWLDYKLALLFVAPSALVVHVTRHYLIPALPAHLSVPIVADKGNPIVLAILVIASLLAFWFSRGRDPRLPAARRALALAVPAVLAVYLMRSFGLPLLPEAFTHGSFSLSRDHVILSLLSAVLLISGIAMLKGREPDVTTDTGGHTPQPRRFPVLKLGALGVGVGALTGVLGAGGGFLVTPALVILARLPIRVAVGTSLLIISANSFAGFAGELERARPDWPQLLTLTGLALVGIAVGAVSSSRIPATHLRRSSGFLLIGVSILIAVAEIRAFL